MGRCSGKRHGADKGLPRRAKQRGKSEGLHKDRRKQARQEARRSKKAHLRSKLKLLDKASKSSTSSSSSIPPSSLEDQEKRRERMEEKVSELAEKALQKQRLHEEKAAREGAERKRKQKRKLLRQQLESQISSTLTRLACWYPGKEARLREREINKLKRDPNKLRGAARPAEEAYPWLYPEYHAEKERQEREEEERELNKGDNYLELYEGKWASHEETRRLVKAHLDLALLLLDEEERQSKQAEEVLRKLEDQEGEQLLDFRLEWMLSNALIDMGELGHARVCVQKALKRASNQLNAEKDERSSDQKEEDDLNEKDMARLKHADNPFVTMLVYDLLFIEYMSCRVLEEEDADEKVLAQLTQLCLTINPSIAFLLMFHEITQEKVDVLEVSRLVSQEQEEALDEFVKTKRIGQGSRLWSKHIVGCVYFARAIEWWKDAGEQVDSFFEENFAMSADAVGEDVSQKELKGLGHAVKQVWDVVRRFGEEQMEVLQEEGEDDSQEDEDEEL